MFTYGLLPCINEYYYSCYCMSNLVRAHSNLWNSWKDAEPMTLTTAFWLSSAAEGDNDTAGLIDCLVSFARPTKKAMLQQAVKLYREGKGVYISGCCLGLFYNEPLQFVVSKANISIVCCQSP